MQHIRTIPFILGPAALLATTATAQISFQPADSYALVTQRPDWVTVGDFDGVNGPDLAVTVGGPQNQNGPEYVEIFDNLGNGTFVSGQQIFMGNNVGVAAAVARDFDGDGDMDLAVSQKDANSVRVLFNTGGVFSFGGVVGVSGSEPRHMASADIDGDGDMDLVTSNRDSNNLSVLKNDGNGTFTFSGLVATGLEPRYIVLANLDNDSFPDLGVASHDSRRVDVLFNTGTGSFGGLTSYPVPGNEKPSGMAAADLDGDGDMDLTTTSDNNNAGIVVVLMNQGATFTSQTFFTGGQNPGAVVAADLDLDGDRDVATADEDANLISALPNTGTGFLGNATSFPVGAHPSHLESADLDGNGSPDLATVNRDSNNLMVLLNTRSGGTLGTLYCGPANVNSSGGPATISATGSASAAANDVTLTATGMATGEFGYFLNSLTQGFVQNPGGSQGNLCLGGQIGRYNAQVQNSGAAGQISVQIDLANTPTPTGTVAIAAGETWNFTCWFRDGASSNFTEGLSITFN